MNPRTLLAIVLALVGGGSAAQDDEVRRLTEESRKIAVQLTQQVRGELVKEMEHSGPLRSVIVCKYSVPEISSSLSRLTGTRVSRVSLRPRNPLLGGPDAWEQKVLQDFEKRTARGEKADALEHAEVVAEPSGRYFRYMKAIPVAAPCLACHGPLEQISEGVKGQLNNEYPYDKAVGYSIGQVRGAVTVKRPL
jgi:hypothetical protein